LKLVEENAQLAAARQSDPLQGDQLVPASKDQKVPKTGSQSFPDVSPSWITALYERAAEHNNQIL